jgi:polyhydroxyalkanoate synthesis regulator phasin
MCLFCGCSKKIDILEQELNKIRNMCPHMLACTWDSAMTKVYHNEWKSLSEQVKKLEEKVDKLNKKSMRCK